ncbi:hypothetical protein MCAMS1_01478 [biofilm metagenome]
MRTALYALLIIALTGIFSYWYNLPADIGLDVPDGKLNSLSFAPFREGQNPLLLQFPTPEQIDEDLALMADKTHTIRTYSITGGMNVIPELARKHGLEMILGGWVGYYDYLDPEFKDTESRLEIEALVAAANAYPDVVKRVIVGNEVLLRGERTPEDLIKYIREVKQRVKQPVSYADVWSMYMKHPQIIKEVDFITIHILPYWEDEPIPVEKAPAHIERIYKQVQKEAETISPGKAILIGETGWPSVGRQRGWAIPGVVNEAAFIRGLLKVAADNHFDVNIVEAFNQSWKSELEGVIGANWGLFTVDRKEVFPLTGPVYENHKWFGQYLIAAFIAALFVFCFAKKLQKPPTQGLIAFLVFAQILAYLLVFLGDKSWYTSYDNWQRFRSVLVIVLNTSVIALVLSRACDVLTGAMTSNAKGQALRWVYAVVLLVAMVKTYSLATDGRYVSFPFEIGIIPVIGLLGLFVLRSMADKLALTNLNFHELLGSHRRINKQDKYIGWLILLYMGGLIVGEIIAFTVARDFIQAYPGMGERLKWAVSFTVTNRQLLLWLVCLAVLALTRLVSAKRAA